MEKTDIWSRLAAPLPAGVVAWRQDGKASQRDGKHFARFVAYIEANTVRERLDTVVPGEWDLTLELLPALPVIDAAEAVCSFKARLQILGVIREDVGTGRDYKQAATDAFKRAAVRFGVAHELYSYEQNWVQVDGDGRFARALEDPQTAYNRRFAGRTDVVGVTSAAAAGQSGSVGSGPSDAASFESTAALLTVSASPATDDNTQSCPKCGGRMWDNRLSKRNPKAPDYKCRDRTCDGVVWPPKAAGRGAKGDEQAADAALPLATGTDDIPF